MPLNFAHKYSNVHCINISATSGGQTWVINSCQILALQSLCYLNSLTCNALEVCHLLTLHYMQ